jgi:hypothetical protein
LRTGTFSPNLSAMRSAWLGVALALGLGCRMDDDCAPTGDPCGGDPTGEWTIAGSCRDPFYQPPRPVTYFGQAETMARQPPPEATSSDWCSYLTYDPTMGITNFVFPYDTLQVTSGRVGYDGGGAYAALLSTTGKGAVDISVSCLTRFGAVPSCRSPAAPPATHSLTDDLRAYSVSLGSPFQDIDCADDGRGGCSCTYTIAFEPSGGGLSGRWSTQATLMTHFAGTKLIPSQADFCVAGDTMTLWGHDRAAIWDQPGLRTVTLQRMP